MTKLGFPLVALVFLFLPRWAHAGGCGCGPIRDDGPTAITPGSY